VSATAATYSWPDDPAYDAVLAPAQAHQVVLRTNPKEALTHEGGSASFSVAIENRADRPIEVVVTPSPAPGIVSPTTQELVVAANSEGEASFVWESTDLPSGVHELRIAVRAHAAGLGSVVRHTAMHFGIESPAQPTISVAKVASGDRWQGQPFEIYAEIENRHADQPATVSASCVIVEAHRHLPSQQVQVAPGGKAALRWKPTEGSDPLPRGFYTARVSVPDVPGAIGQAGFVVR
jgi:hypothetical protein